MNLDDMNRTDATAAEPTFGGGAADTAASAEPVEPPLRVPAELSEDIVAAVDFSEIELAPELTESPHVVTPVGVLPLEPSPIEGTLRKAALRVPDEIDEASGFSLFGRRIKSMLYSTDVAVIRNANADAVFAVYPFTAQPAITQALLTAAECPVFVGVGGGTTQGKRSVQLAAVSEMQGAAGVIVNSPASAEMVSQIVGIVDIPVIATVVRPDDAHAKVRAGAKIINVAAGRDTPAVLRALREAYPTLPLIATGGKSHESVLETIRAGANAIIWTPPSAQMLQADMMQRYRKLEGEGEHPMPSIDPVSAGEVNPLEARPDIPFPDDIIDNVAAEPEPKPGFRFFFRKRK